MSLSKSAKLELAQLINTIETSTMLVQSALQKSESDDSEVQVKAYKSLCIWGDARSEATCFLADKYGIILPTLELDRKTLADKIAKRERASNELRALRHGY